MSLTELKQKAQGCTDCEIGKIRTELVFGEGNPESPLVLVGEGPGEEEDKTGRPFVGRAGKMLDQALADNGLSRDDVYICNTLKCRACEEGENGRKRNRPPTPAEVETCRQWLVPQLAAIAPKVILCIGAPSSKNLIRADFKITKERGQYFPCEYAKTAMATLHPAYVLRRSTTSFDGGYSLIVQDIGRAWEAALKLLEKDESV
jgi:DNA polymerase